MPSGGLECVLIYEKLKPLENNQCCYASHVTGADPFYDICT
jgi:hypothetical protein